LGVDLPVGKLLSEPGLTAWNGASGASIIDVAERYGLVAKPFSNVTLGFLNDIPKPAILHFGNSYTGQGIAHWVVLLEIEGDGKFKVLDLPHRPQIVDSAELLTRWTGNLVVLSRAPIGGHELGRARAFVFPGVVALPLVCLIGLFQRKTRRRVGSLAMLVGAALVFSILWMFLSPLGFERNSFAVCIARSKVPVIGSLEMITNPDAMLPNDDSERAVVDCRLPRDYFRGHVPGAINLPVDATMFETKEALRQLEGKKQLVTYCQSSECHWADHVAGVLREFGFTNVKVFRPGWKGFQSAFAPSSG
jgi:rhodanese-related sulfurtransferase